MVRVSGKPVVKTPARWTPGVLILFLLLHPRYAGALDASLLAGSADSIDTDESTYSWQVDFRENFESPFAASVSWINEGHFRDHHRDGIAGQLWGRIPISNGRFSLAFGAGAYRYFDTRRRPDGGDENVHGSAPVYSLSASYYTETPWFFRFTANHIQPAGGIDTNTFLLGFGFRLGRVAGGKTRGVPSGGAGSPFRNTGVEVTPFLGATIHNSLESRAGIAGGIEFRRGVLRNLDWTLSWINEDNHEEIRRTGIGSQIWAVESFIRRRVVLGLGAGLYTYYDRNPPRGIHSPIDLAGLITLTAGYRFGDRWIARFEWNRVTTDNNRDSDILALGIGRRWNE